MPGVCLLSINAEQHLNSLMALGSCSLVLSKSPRLHVRDMSSGQVLRQLYTSVINTVHVLELWLNNNYHLVTKTASSSFCSSSLICTRCCLNKKGKTLNRGFPRTSMLYTQPGWSSSLSFLLLGSEQVWTGLDFLKKVELGID